MTELIGSNEKHPFIIYYLTLTTVIAGFLFGYDTGIINGALLLIEKDFDVTRQEKETIVGSLVAAAAIFSLTAGVIADVIGRKTLIMISALIFTGGGVCMGLASNSMMLIAGRFIVGAAIGFVSAIVPVYISECSPASIRGLLITMNQLFITLGILISAILAGALQHMDQGWRYMLGISIIPAVLQFLMFLGLPESPRFQVMNNQDVKAEKTLKQIRKKNDVQDELQEMKRAVEEDKNKQCATILKQIMGTPHVRKALIIGCMLQMFQQFCGINAVIYYSSTILITAGFSSKWAIWLAVIPFAINFFATFIGLWAVESVGRKLILALSFLAIGAALLVLAAGFLLSQLNSPLSSPFFDLPEAGSNCQESISCFECLEKKDCGFCYELNADKVEKGSCVNGSSTDKEAANSGRCAKANGTDVFSKPEIKYNSEFCPTEYGWLAVLGMVLFVLGFAPGAGPMPWTINAEIYPQWARSKANSMATVTNWTCNFLLSSFFLTMIDTLTAWGTFLAFCVVCILGAIFVLLFVPETKDKELADVELLFMTEKVRLQTLESRKKKEKEQQEAAVEAQAEPSGTENNMAA